MSAWYMRILSPATSRQDYVTFTVTYRIIFMANNILSATGSLMVIRHVVPERERKEKDVA